MEKPLTLKSAGGQKYAFILDELHRSKSGDFLAFSRAEIAGAAIRGGLDAFELSSLHRKLIAAAISADSWRLLEGLQSRGWYNVPPPRLVAEWAMSLGVDAQTIAAIVAEASGPVDLARAYLKTGRIDVGERQQLEDVAVAYGADRTLALDWIKAAVDAEIDGYIDRARDRAVSGSWWRRLCRWLGANDATARGG